MIAERGSTETNEVTLCAHCQRGAVSQPRGLCCKCYLDVDVREFYPLRTRNQSWSGRSNQYERICGLAPEPTSAKPGTRKKIEVMRERVAAGYRPCHPGDATFGDVEVSWEED